MGDLHSVQVARRTLLCPITPALFTFFGIPLLDIDLSPVSFSKLLVLPLVSALHVLAVTILLSYSSIKVYAFSAHDSDD